MFQQLALTNQLCHRLYVASNAITRAYRPYLQEIDLTYPQYVVMMALWQQDKIEIGKLRSLTKVDGGALSLILKKLQSKELIVLKPSKEDKRIKHINLTSQGSALANRAALIPEKMMCKFSQVDIEDVESLKRVLDKLIVNLEDN